MLISERTVLFPTSGPTMAVNSVTVITYPDRQNAIRTCASDSKRSIIKEVLGYSRDGEGIETIDTDAVVRFNDDNFQGRSFGLALGIADKLARFQEPSTTDTTIAATGTMASKGEIHAVEQFPEKIGFLLKQLPQGSRFFYPLANEPGNEKTLRAFNELGIKSIAVGNLAEISWLWLGEPGSVGRHSLSSGRKLLEFSIGLLIGISVPLVAMMTFLARQ